LGAFQDLRERKIKEGLDENGQYEMNPDDYIGEGIMRELVGRFSLITATKSLTKQDLMDILMKSEISPLTQLQNLGRQIYQKDILINEDMVEKIAEEALQFDTGARALATIVNGIREQVLDALINGDETQIVIDEELLQRVRDARKRGVAK
jgi:ATP-dependent Clp protease ATP-binding subunit ClpX